MKKNVVLVLYPDTGRLNLPPVGECSFSKYIFSKAEISRFLENEL